MIYEHSAAPEDLATCSPGDLAGRSCEHEMSVQALYSSGENGQVRKSSWMGRRVQGCLVSGSIHFCQRPLSYLYESGRSSRTAQWKLDCD